MNYSQNDQLKLAFDFVQYTGMNLFLTGKAGTGKTTFLKSLRNKLFKRMIVVAPTGVAAINAGGVTIHSFFQLPFGPIISSEFAKVKPVYDDNNQTEKFHLNKFSREKIRIIRSLDLLIIDEISMVRSDLLDAIDEVLRRYKNRSLPFGGTQLLMIGDLNQLAPVVKEDDHRILKDYYDSYFFFGSRALQKTNFISIELTHIFRQSDEHFIELLNNIREKKNIDETISELNKRYIPGFHASDKDGYITLTTHNNQAQAINDKKLKELNGKSHKFKATIKGDFPEYSYPTDQELELKNDAQVMFVKNDTSLEKLFYNGKIGVITGFDEDKILVKCKDDDFEIPVEITEWQNIKYEINEETKEITENVVGSFFQYPLKLAWAITIHKSQGLTFEKAIIDARDAFAFGQVYVALSRCKTLDGMVLSTPINQSGIKSDFSVSSFNNEMEKNRPDENILEKARKEFEQTQIIDLFDFSAITRKFGYFIKLFKENESAVDKYSVIDYPDLFTKLKTEITQVSEKFHGQLKTLMVGIENCEKDEKLQSRIKSGSAYFYEKAESLIWEEISPAKVESDNKAIRKTLNDALTRVKEELFPKLACLNLCKEGFMVKKYLEIKAKSSIHEMEAKKQKKAVSDEKPDFSKHPKLYELLRQWRTKTAAAQNKPAFIVMHQKTFAGIIDSLPITIKELKKVKGFGKQKLEVFGEEVLDIVIKYVSDNNIDVKKEVVPEKESKNIKPDSKAISFELLKSGKTIQQIAAERGFAVSTIEAHLAYYVGTGELPVENILDKEKIDKISDYFLNAKSPGLTAAFQSLGEKFTYTELRFVYNHLQVNGLVKTD